MFTADYFQRLRLPYDELLSNVAFNFNVRLYNAAGRGTALEEGGGEGAVPWLGASKLKPVETRVESARCMFKPDETRVESAWCMLKLVETRASHSSTFRLDVSTFCGIHWVISVFQCPKTSQNEPRSGRVSAPRSTNSC